MSGPMLGRQHPSKPVTKEDRDMSQRHLATRARFDDARPTAANLQKSIAYNEDHAKEHLKAVKEREKDLEKVQKKAGKR